MTIHDDRKKVEQVVERHGEVFSMRGAVACGVAPGCVRRVEAAGHIVRLSKNCFVPTSIWSMADGWQQFRLRSIAFGLGASAHILLTGPSSQIIHGLPIFTSPPDLPVAIRVRPTSSGTNLTPHARVRTGFVPTAHQWREQDIGIVSTSYTAIDVARHSIPAEALAVVDHVLHSGVSRERLSRLVEDLKHYPGIEQAAWAMEHGDDRAESPLESLGRLAFLEAGLPAPLSNVWIFDGRRRFRVDHLIPEHGVILEGDGGLKLNNREDAHRVVRDQIERESWLRGRGFAVERYDYWMGWNARSKIIALAQRAARSQLGKPIPTCWSMDIPRLLQSG